ncbi:MAG: fused MFS/spermidine synthase [Acidobacteriia bacterium]|nr:fused MFS/spermidine synthase [Terriglobia bacterium]
MIPPVRHRGVGIYVLFFVSGATGLVYEVIWLRQLILVLGSTLFATSAVLTAFMGGLALGSFAAGRLVDRSSAPPLRYYGLLEVGIGAYALLVPVLFRALTPIYSALWNAGGDSSYVLFSLAKTVGVLAVLLPPTFLMGASLPVLARQVADDPDRIGGEVGSLYAVNTFGAMVGTFLAGVIAIPAFGVRHTLWSTAVVNFLVGIGALLLARRVGMPPAAMAAQAREAGSSSRGARLALWLFAASGFAAMVLEVAWTRGLALIVGSSVYAFSLMLLAFLTGLAAGSAAFSAWLKWHPRLDPGALLAGLLGGAGILAYGTTFLFQWMPRFFAEVYFRGGLGPNEWLAVQFLIGFAVMFPATFALGGIFPAVLQLRTRGLDSVGASVGSVYAANTFGTIAGSAAAGFVVVPLLGVRSALLAVAFLEVALGLVAALGLRPTTGRTRWALALLLAAAAVTIPAVRPGWDTLLMNSGVYMNVVDLPEDANWSDFLRRVIAPNRLLFFEEGLTASVMVADQPAQKNRFLSVNGKVEASTRGDMETQLMCAHLPLLLHPSPKDVLVIGLASGITAGAVATHPVRSIRVVEIEAAMVPAARQFASVNGDVLDDPRLVLAINDARNELTFSPRRYDVVVSEPSNPWMTVASNLFTEEFFRLARQRLYPSGIFCQWVQTYGLATEDLRSIVAAFHAAFPSTLLFETFDGTDLLLLGSEAPIALDLDRMARRMSELRVFTDLGRVGVRRPADILPLFRLGTPQVDLLVAGANRNTDDNARVEFSAPKAMYEDTSDSTLAYIERFAASPLDQVVPSPGTPEERDRLRVQLVKAWLARGEAGRARKLAAEISTDPFRAEAQRLLTGSPRRSLDPDLSRPMAARDEAPGGVPASP